MVTGSVPPVTVVIFGGAAASVSGSASTPAPRTNVAVFWIAFMVGSLLATVVEAGGSARTRTAIDVLPEGDPRSALPLLAAADRVGAAVVVTDVAGAAGAVGRAAVAAFLARADSVAAHADAAAGEA